MQSRETQITMVKWTNAGRQTKRANERSFVYRPPAWRRWRNLKTTYWKGMLVLFECKCTKHENTKWRQYFYVSFCWKRNCHFTWPSEPRVVWHLQTIRPSSVLWPRQKFVGHFEQELHLSGSCETSLNHYWDQEISCGDITKCWSYCPLSLSPGNRWIGTQPCRVGLNQPKKRDWVKGVVVVVVGAIGGYLNVYKRSLC